MRFRPRPFPLAALAALAALLGCLPEPPASPDATATRDLPPLDVALPFRVLSVRIEDPSGRRWDARAAPRRPTVVFEASRAWAAGTSAWLLSDALGEATLTEDLARAPARIATLDTRLAATSEVRDAELRLTAGAPLALGEGFRWALPAWAEAADGSVLGAPVVASGQVASTRAGATLTATWPPAGAAGVPATLTGAAFRFDDALANLEGLSLAGPEGPIASRVSPVPCAAFAWEDGTCAALHWDGWLAPGPHVLAVAAEVRDWTGGAVGPREAPFVVTGTSPELALLPLTCARDENAVEGTCVRADDERVVLRATANAPVRAELATERGTAAMAAPRGEATLVLGALPPATELAATLTVTGLDGASLVRPLTLATAPPLPTLALAEVCSDPVGREPRQEWVEVLNYGDVPVVLAALTLADSPDATGDALPPVTLAPGGRALVVADAFEADESPEPIPAGVPLLRIGTSLASGGLTNAGEPVLLRDGEARRLSTAPARATGAGLCLRNGAPERREGPWAVGPCTPGAP